MIVQVYKNSKDDSKKDVATAMMYSSQLHGRFLSDSVNWEILKGLSPELAAAIVELANDTYRMGLAQAKRDIANKLGL